MRCVPIQFWPAAHNAPDTHDVAASSRSQSFRTMTGALPPRSIASFLRPAELAILSPVANPPVNEIILTSRDETSASPSAAPPVATDTTFGGMPAATRYPTSLIADSGVSSEGLRTTALP